MKKINERLELINRRGELLAELFLQDLKPFFVARNTSADFGIDFFVGFQNPRGGVNLVAVEVKVTEHLVKDRYPLPRRTHDLLANSNIPGFLLIVDVKENRIYYQEPRPHEVDTERKVVPVKVVEVDQTIQRTLTEKWST